jgi:rhodanese-related sulfurtransferase
MMRQSEIETDKPVAFLCRSGRRSELAVLQLQQFGFSDLYNVTGGIIAYSQLVDKTLKPI